MDDGETYIRDHFWAAYNIIWHRAYVAGIIEGFNSAQNGEVLADIIAELVE
jgi:hypothetical protein